MRLARRLAKLVPFAVGLLVVIQLVPYGRDHSNPPVTAAARWPAGPGRQIAERSCYDCHSNLTRWRWYSNVAPVSWLVQHDVEEGRGNLNFSEWNRRQPKLSELIDQVSSGGMPPTQYRIAHPSVALSSSQKASLAAALTKLYASDPPSHGAG